jgi:polyhydroxyalkanoate synthesis regulator phasin
MSQRDLTAELRGARITAPPELRERVRQIAAADTTRAGRFTWRRALVLALPVAAAVAAAVVVTRPSDNPSTTPEVLNAPGVVHGSTAQIQPARTKAADSATGAAKLAVPSTPNRVQVYGAYLALRLNSATAVSDGVKSALRIAASLGGYPTSVHANSEAKDASADLVLKIPRTNVQAAISRLSALGTITSEQVDIQDKQAGLNATDRKIQRLQKQIASLETQSRSAESTARIAALRTQVARLQRAAAETRRAAHYATVQLHLTSAETVVPAKQGHGPLHGVVVALTWLGIGAVYALAIGTPVALLALLAWLLVRVVRRRREDALLSRS